MVRSQRAGDVVSVARVHHDDVVLPLAVVGAPAGRASGACVSGVTS